MNSKQKKLNQQLKIGTKNRTMTVSQQRRIEKQITKLGRNKYRK